MGKLIKESFHDRSLEAGQKKIHSSGKTSKPKLGQELSYQFELHEHPFAAQLMQALVQGGVDALQEQDTAITAQDFFSVYGPTELVASPLPRLELDTLYGRPYAVYNWELFYHLITTISTHLFRNGHYAEARTWLHYIFDPTSDSEGDAPARYWKFKPFQTTQVELIETILMNLSTHDDADLFATTVECIEQWRQNPFRPHLIARFRPSEYMIKTVTLYLDNLIAWGDSRYRRETREDINEALQLYILAGTLLGDPPERSPKKGNIKPETYASLRIKLDAMNNALADLEADLPFDLMPLPGPASSASTQSTSGTAGQALYFCVPSNAKLLAYWDTLADRLFKIRNSLNLQGVFRQLPLFAPPIDPGLLAAGVAAGLDIASLAAGALQPVPLVRFVVLAQKASELCQEVKSLGGQLLATLEKHDGERLGLLRAQYEVQLLELGEVTKYAQLQEATKAREGLEITITNIFARYVYFERQLGRAESEIKAPTMDALDAAALEAMDLSASEPTVAGRAIAIDIAQATEADGHLISSQEKIELQKAKSAQDANDAGAALDIIAAVMQVIPQMKAHIQPVGVGATIEAGGRQLAEILRIGASVARAVASSFSSESVRAARIAGYARRDQDWTYQSNVAAGELAQAYKQLRAAQIREAIATHELATHRRQIENSRSIETFLTDDSTGKVTNVAFYAWMKNEVRGLYSRAFDLAYEVAKKAERALQNELGDPDLRFIAPSYDDAGHQGLLSGEKLYSDLKRMEVGYLDKNARELELTRHVSLRLLDPEALLQLRLTNSCEFEIPEWLLHLHGPHYFCRIKTVGLSPLCVAGPYTSVSAKLTLLRSRIRTTPALAGDEWAWQGDDDPRFTDVMGAQESIVTSTGSNDAGLFEVNLRDERYLPFEGRGAWSSWSLELPSFAQFDYDTLSDVILHLRYTARDAGSAVADKVSTTLVDDVKEAAMLGSKRLFSLRHDFPMEWNQYKNLPAASPATISIELKRAHYPYWSRLLADDKMVIRSLKLIVRSSEAPADTAADGETPGSLALTWQDGSATGTYEATLSTDMPALGRIVATIGPRSAQEIWILCEWGAPSPP